MAMRPDVIQELEPELESVEGDRHRSWVWHVIRGSTQAKVGLGILLFFIVLAVLAPWIEPYDVHTKVGPVYAHPSLAHPFGLDDGGIDERGPSTVDQQRQHVDPAVVEAERMRERRM